jgi:hypothetical protein
LPHNRGIIAVGQKIVSNDCSTQYTCNGPQQNPQVQNLQRCSPNAQCRGNANGQPKCYCKPGFEGNGYDCRLIRPTPPPNPCLVPNVCGSGARCWWDIHGIWNPKRIRGIATCYCVGTYLPNGEGCCHNKVIPKGDGCCHNKHIPKGARCCKRHFHAE